MPERHDRRYVSIFGELAIDRVVYGTRQGQRIERVPLDERLGLPEGEFSYVLEDWGQRLCLKGSFAEAGHSLEMLLGLRLRTRTLEHMSRQVVGYAPAFQDALPSPPPEGEGPLMVVTADGKGVPMRADRSCAWGEKQGSHDDSGVGPAVNDRSATPRTSLISPHAAIALLKPADPRLADARSGGSRDKNHASGRVS